MPNSAAKLKQQLADLRRQIKREANTYEAQRRAFAKMTTILSAQIAQWKAANQKDKPAIYAKVKDTQSRQRILGDKQRVSSNKLDAWWQQEREILDLLKKVRS